MSGPYEFETIAWNGEAEAAAETPEFENSWEMERPGFRRMQPRNQRPAGRVRRFPRRRRLVPVYGASPWTVAGIGSDEPAGGMNDRRSSEHALWVQSTLNRVLGMRLRLTGVMNANTRAAVRSFQSQQGIPADGIVGPDTEAALLRASGGVGRGKAPAAQPTRAEPAADGALPTEPDQEAFFGEMETEWEMPTVRPRGGGCGCHSCRHSQKQRRG
jgi:Putative peptidoglycan binding domain